MIKLLRKIIINYFQPNLENFIIQLVDILLDPIFTEIEQSVSKASIGTSKKGLSKILFQSRVVNNEFINDKFQKVFMKLFYKKYIVPGARSLHITEKAHLRIKKWSIPTQYKYMLDHTKELFIKDYRNKENK